MAGRVAPACRNFGQIVYGYGDLLRKRAGSAHAQVAAQNQAPVPCRKRLDPRPDAYDGTDGVAPEHMRKGWPGGILPLRQIAVSGIQTRIVNPEDDIALAGNRIRHLPQMQSANAGQVIE